MSRTQRNPLGCLALAVLLLAAPAVSEDIAAPLRFDPFAIPSLSTGAAPYTGSSLAFEPELRSTLVAGVDSMANLGGVVLRVGEETHGYTLESVSDFEAVFLKDGLRLSIPLRTSERGR